MARFYQLTLGALFTVFIPTVLTATPTSCTCPTPMNSCSCFCDSQLVIIAECISTYMDASSSNKTLKHLPTSLTYFFFNGNNLQYIGDNMFGTNVHLNNLTFLSLSNNSIESISGRAFHRIPNLETLMLDDNHWLLHGTHRVFSNIRKLKFLSLNNAFKENMNITFQLTHLSMVFHASHLVLLQNLSLCDNNIPLINLDLNLPSLAHLNLSHNDIGSVKLNASDLKNLKTLDLSHNSITSVDKDAILQFKLLNDLTVLDLRSNKFVCDCYLKDFHAWLMMAPKLIVHRETLTCWSADQDKFRGGVITTLKAEDLTCSPTPDTPKPVESSVIVLSVILAIVSLLFVIVLFMNREKLKYRSMRILSSLRESWNTHDGYSSVKA